MAYTSLDFGITCIDADYVSPGMACFYLLEEGDECAVLETGTSHSASALWDLLQTRNIAREQVRYVIPTHVHLDHAGGAGALMAALPNAQLLIHPRGARHMADPERLVSASKAVYGDELFHTLYGDVVAVDKARIREMQDGDSVALSGRQLEFRHTRGHAEHHQCIWDATSRGWFSGDMFGVSYPWCRFPNGDFVLPSTTPSQFDPAAFIASLKLLGSYAPQRMYLTHYGELAYSEDKAQLLARQIEAYCELATTGSPDPVQLQQLLSDYSLDLLKGFDTQGSATEQRNRISFDMQLNAQGLQIWRQRTAH
ncbi:2-aminobenzoylacetyl-CoA thioesterase [Halioglobus japonicus]|nr:2-aminobenzoylacetyl-CoA thioesterase [Halioglobus japonicus]